MTRRESLENKLKMLQSEQERIASEMKDIKIHTRGKATTEYDELKVRLFEVDMKVIDVKEELEKEAQNDDR